MFRFPISIVVILLFLPCQKMIGQAIQIDYIMKTDFSIPYSEEFELHFDDSRSLFIEKSGIKNLLSKKNNSDEGIVFQKEIERTLPDAEFIFKKKNESHLIFMENWYDNLLTVKDTVILDWIIKDDIKMIGQFKCQKATVKFRGRKYESWFSLEHNYSFGPYKFHGLPGIVIQIYSLDSKVSFNATKMFSVNSSDVLYKYQNKVQESKILDLKTYRDVKSELVDADLRKSWVRLTQRSGSSLPYKKCEDCSESGIEIYD